MKKEKKNILEYRSYYLDENFPIFLLHGDHWKISDVPSTRLHFHNCLEIGICHSDSGIMEIQGNKIPFHAGDITCILQYVPHTTYSTLGTNSHWSYLFIDLDRFANMTFGSFKKDFFSDITTNIYSAKEYPRMTWIIHDIINQMILQDGQFQWKVYGLLLSLLTELSDYSKKDKTIVSNDYKILRIAPALKYIDNNYMHNISIDDLSKVCHLSQTYFRSIFHEIMGKSPLEYLNGIRIINACHLLRTSNLPIIEIASEIGFQSLSSFNRNFIKIVNITPREYRKKLYADCFKDEQLQILKYNGWMVPEIL